VREETGVMVLGGGEFWKEERERRMRFGRFRRKLRGLDLWIE
jgi:hypothetical protein